VVSSRIVSALFLKLGRCLVGRRPVAHLVEAFGHGRDFCGMLLEQSRDYRLSRTLRDPPGRSRACYPLPRSGRTSGYFSCPPRCGRSRPVPSTLPRTRQLQQVETAVRPTAELDGKRTALRGVVRTSATGQSKVHRRVSSFQRQMNGRCAFGGCRGNLRTPLMNNDRERDGKVMVHPPCLKRPSEPGHENGPDLNFKEP
jgi:hypothetical protein